MVTLGGDVTVMVTLFSKVLPQSAVLRHCLRKLWTYCPPGQVCEHRKTLMSNFGLCRGTAEKVGHRDIEKRYLQM